MSHTTTTTTPESYTSWTRDQLIERLLLLESTSNTKKPSSSSSSTRPVSKKEFNFSTHSKRKIALKFCYSGSPYCGLAYQTPGTTELPSVEGVLFEAMGKARLIDWEGGMEGCGWERCGRTDRGVSAAGQVVSVWVRSAGGKGVVEGGVLDEGEKEKREVVEEEGVALDGLPGLVEEDFGTLDISEPPSPMTGVATAKPVEHELDYISILNRILPPTIRILAWSPVSPDFSARFSCKYRHYKYIFSSHHLHIPLMRSAATRLVGEHDFRNLCKVDAQKQITRFKRVILRADIERVDGDGDGEEGEGTYVFNLVGSAFLYHQVRHIMAILFLIGTGLEKPSLITQLMNVVEGAETPFRRDDDDDVGLLDQVIDRKPEYQMADALPLMLWDCGYAEEDIKWRTGNKSDDHGDSDQRRSGLGTETDLYHQLQSVWNRSKIHNMLDRHFLYAAEKYHAPPSTSLPLLTSGVDDVLGPVNYPLGGGTYKRAIKYVPVLERNRNSTVEEINERWRLGKGARKAEREARRDDDDGDE